MQSEVRLMGVTTLQSRGQLTIPADIRRSFGWKPGDSIVFQARPDGVLELRAVKRLTIQALLEKYSQDGVAPALDDLRRAAADDYVGHRFWLEDEA